MLSKFAFQFNSFNQDVKAGKGGLSRGIRPHCDSRKRAFSNGNYERTSSKLANENAKC